MACLNISCPESKDADIFVQVEKYNSQGYRQGTQMIRPQNRILQTVLQTCHDWNFGMSQLALVFSWGPDGWLRASHATERDEQLFKPAQPYYTHAKSVFLSKGEVRNLEVPMRPASMVWRVSIRVSFIYMISADDQ